MRRVRPAFVAIVSVALVVVAGWLVRAPGVGAARPYEGITIRAVVNAEYVK